MTAVTLSAPTTSKSFPAGTVDPGYTFSITGTQADGTPFSATTTGPSPTLTVDLPDGTYTGTVSKLSEMSQPSDPLTVGGGATVTLTVPDVAGKATLALA